MTKLGCCACVSPIWVTLLLLPPWLCCCLHIKQLLWSTKGISQTSRSLFQLILQLQHHLRLSSLMLLTWQIRWPWMLFLPVNLTTDSSLQYWSSQNALLSTVPDFQETQQKGPTNVQRQDLQSQNLRIWVSAPRKWCTRAMIVCVSGESTLPQHPVGEFDMIKDTIR